MSRRYHALSLSARSGDVTGQRADAVRVDEHEWFNTLDDAKGWAASRPRVDVLDENLDVVWRKDPP